MPTYGGKEARGKIIKVKPYAEEGDDKLLWLTERQRGLLLAMTEYLDWRSRWAELPSPLDDDDIRDSYVSGLKNRLMIMVEFCAEVINCIETDEGTRNAFADFMAERFPSLPGNEIPDSVAEQNQYGSALGCDNDDGWGHIRNGLIERSFQRVTDVLEQIEVTTDNQEMLAIFLNAIPGVGAFFDVIPVTDWVLFFDNVREWMAEQFAAGDTVALRDDIACDLFCIWQENCSLSFAQIRDYYFNKTTELVPVWENAFNSFAALGAAMGSLSTTSFGTNIVYALVGSQYGFLTFINDWFGVSIEVTGNDLALGDPSDDWLVLCDDCPIEAYNVGLFSLCGTGTISSVEFESGVPFDIVAYEITVIEITSYMIALKLPPGNWNIELNSITGTVTPPADTSETAYAWNDSTGFHNVLWNVPASPADFGTHDTQDGVYEIWCATQGWNAALFNSTPFTANFTATLIP